MSKKPKDVNAPKKNQSSYFIYSNERRSILQSEHRDKKITEISKLISAEWKSMAPTEKQKYEEKAREEKIKYNLQFTEYKKTDNYRKYEIKLAEWKQNEAEMGRGVGGRGKGGGPKAPRKPDAMPKRPQTSYFIFSNERRKDLQSTYPDKKITELSKLISNEWKEKTDSDKKIYESQSAINKQRYNVEMESYKETEEYKSYMVKVEQYRQDKKRWDNYGGDASSSGLSSTGLKKISLPRKPKDKQCPKRPLSSYFLFAKEVREKTKSEFPDKQITEIAKEISKKWNKLNEEEKQPYNQEAARLKEIYKKDLEVYKGSDAAKQFEEKLAEWKLECDKRKQAARAKELKKIQITKKKSPVRGNKKKGGKGKGKKRKMDIDSDSSDSDSDSDSDSSSSGSSDSSGSDSDSDSSSSDDSSSGSDSDSSSD